MFKTRVLPFEYEVLKKLKALKTDWSKTSLLLAVSGGRDSVSLVHVLSSIQSRLGFRLALAHVHHGQSSDSKTKRYRNQAEKFCQQLAKKFELEFFLLKFAGGELKSEAEFRKERETLLEKCRLENQFNLIVFAHHADDLLETRLIRLIRGTGPQGLKAMDILHGKKLRPFLSFASSQIISYVEQNKISWLNDPTNADETYFRNWIRNNWLPQLEMKRAGSKQTLARSLEQISDTLEYAQNDHFHSEVINRKEFASLTVVEKREVLARVMLATGARDFSRRQIDEILKRLSGSRSANRRKMSFEIGGLEWRVNAEQIEAVHL